MMRELLSVNNVRKVYPTYGSELTRYARWFGLPMVPRREFVAVDGVSFSVKEGETVAIIGQNGAGKSTLLKLITGTIRPTNGSVGVGGQVKAILELGLGFNAEFTGRENLRHSGGLLGHSPEELSRLIPEIEAFTELGKFLDQPLRTYSSGMMARLAFGLATAVRPELLIVDEVLSVGDSYFAHKSFHRIRKFRQEGSAILFVTHSMADVRELCDRVLLMKDGIIIRDGPPDEVCDFYNAMIAAKEKDQLTIEQRRQEDGWLLSRSGTGEAKVAKFALVDRETGESVKTASVGQKLRIVLDIEVTEEIPHLVLGFMVRDRNGHIVYGTNTWHTDQILHNVPAAEAISYRIDFDCNLGPGSYSVSPALVSTQTHLEINYEWTDNLLVFDVFNFDRHVFVGTSQLPVSISISRGVV